MSWRAQVCCWNGDISWCSVARVDSPVILRALSNSLSRLLYASPTELLLESCTAAGLLCCLQSMACPRSWEKGVECSYTTMFSRMASKSRRGALRGAEGRTLDLIFNTLTSEQWAKLLKGPLQCAAVMGDRDLAQRLVRAGAEFGDALHDAIERGHREIVGDLLESGASLDAKDSTGFTAIQIAARCGQSEMVQLLLLKGASKDGSEGLTPLYLAAHFGHVDAVLALLAAGADVNLRRSLVKRPAIQVSAQNGHVDIVRALLERGANVDAAGIDGDTGLHSAASNNHVEAIDVIIEAGANVEARNCHGYAPLHHASINLRRAAILRLLKHGANVNAQDDCLITPLLFAAAHAGTRGAAKVVDSLLRAGADETIVSDDGRKPVDAIGVNVAEESRLADEIERVRKLLVNAPADRAWRRRGYLVLCRAHLDRAQQIQADISRAEADGCHEVVVGGHNVDGIGGGDWAVVVAKMLQLQEEGIFRTIVGYL